MFIDSETMGNARRFLALPDLGAALPTTAGSPSDRGRVTLIVSRTEGGVRTTPDRARLTREGGVPDDAWGRKEGAKLEGQITVMETPIARLMANGQPLTLFGDNLFLELDLSIANLPPGSRVAIGSAVLEVTTKPHRGCSKFSGRFGADALRFTATPEGRARRFRGVYMYVVAAGDVSPGDAVEVLERAQFVEDATV
ncbi:MAG: MOSC domain-containing protein [Actinomycetota bacterium]